MMWALWYALLLIFPLSIALLLTKEGVRHVHLSVKRSRRRRRLGLH